MIVDYVTPEGEANLRKYVYRGGDGSLAYKYVFGHIAQFCVEHLIPQDLAPNVITLFGLISCLVPHLLIAWYANWNQYGVIPNWLSILAGVMTLVYLNFDNMDGKQARRTKSSSPLGLLFDHGCDALNLSLLGMNVSTVMNGGNGFYGVYGIAWTYLVFYGATWEEYYVDGMFLGPINGASEGVILSALVMIFNGIVGQSFWELSPFGFPNKLFFFYLSAGLGVFCLVTNAMNIRKKHPELLGKALADLAPAFLLFSSFLIIEIFSKSQLMATHARFLLYFFGINFARYVTHIQIAHVARETYAGLGYIPTLYVLLLLLNTIVSSVRGKAIFDELTFFWVLFFLSFVSYAHLVLNVIRQFTRALNINCLTIKKKTN